MSAIKEAPKPKTGNGQGPMKEAAPQATTPQRTYATPFGFMRRFTEELDRLYEEFGLEAGWLMPRLLTRGGELLGKKPADAAAEWTPRIEVFEREGQLVVRADLPGMTREDVKVEVAPEYILLQGERKVEEKEEREKDGEEAENGCRAEPARGFGGATPNRPELHSYLRASIGWSREARAAG